AALGRARRAGRRHQAGREPRGRRARRRARRGRRAARQRAHRDARARRGARRVDGRRRRRRGARVRGAAAHPGGGDVVIRVVLVDDQTLVRQGIRSLLELADDVEVVAEAGDGQAGLAAIAAHRPDVVLLDLRMPVLDGLGVLEAIDRDAPAVLVLTTFDDDDAVLAALRAGARGYLLKDVTLDGLLDAIRTVAAGGRLIQPAVTAGLLDRLIRGDVPDRPDVSGTPGEDL